LLSADHEDLVQQTLLNLSEYFDQRQDQIPTQDETSAIAFTILKRRIADRFRDAARRAVYNQSAATHLSVSRESHPDRHVRHRRVLWAVLSLLATLDKEDQNLLLREHMSLTTSGRRLTAVQRKRLSRLRERLRRQLKDRFGISLEEYLAG
jgi:DNA-directed RNA polymerase specialized sigma24 family protein